VPATAFTGAAHVRTVNLSAAADRVAIRARRRCGPGTTLTVTVDRHAVVTRRIRSTSWQALSVAMAIPAGRRRVALTVVGGRSAHCRRPLALGALRLLAASPAGPTTQAGGTGGTPSPTTTTPAPTGAEGVAPAPSSPGPRPR
jgi:hypothetical protein